MIKRKDKKSIKSDGLEFLVRIPNITGSYSGGAEETGSICVFGGDVHSEGS